MKFCKKCLFPNTKPDLSFNVEGVCSACINAEYKANRIDWELRKKEFEKIIDRHLNKSSYGYDCIIPVSGGKDSTYQTYFMKEVYGLNPLCICFETTYETELGRLNLDNISKMGVDLIKFKKNFKVYKSMVIEGFKRVGDEMWPNHLGIFTVPVNFAVKFKIPLIIWGENSQLEYGAPNEESSKSNILDRKWLEEFGGLLGYRVEDMIGLDGITKKDLTPYIYPSEAEIENVGLEGVFLGSYFFWDARKQLEIIRKKGFKVKEDGPVEGTFTNYENLDEKTHSLHDYLKYVKYGFGRATDHASIDIRNKRITREQGLELVKKYDGKYPHLSIQTFIEYSNMSKGEIDEIIDSFTNPMLFEMDEKGNFKRDSDYNLIPAFKRI